MTSSEKGRAKSLRCTGDPAGPGPVPVLLVHGTALTALENWGSSYFPALLAEGHAVCTVSLPEISTGDLQRSIEYVATAIRTFNDTAGRPISVLGHSQGAFLPRIALKVWPDLAARVDDVIGLAGVYERGSEALVPRCADECVVAMRQMATGSKLLRALNRRPLPEGPSYTNIGTLNDGTVTPQPAANKQRGAKAIEIQDVCPGREIPISEHGLIIGDAVAKALVDDALGHRGPAKARRVPTATCNEVFYPTFAPNPFLEAAPFIKGRLHDTTPTEVGLRCHLRQNCADAKARGRLVESLRRTVTPKAIIWRGAVPLDGHVRVSTRGSSIVRRVRPGDLRLRVKRPAGRGVMVLETRPDRYSVWARESAVRMGSSSR